MLFNSPEFLLFLPIVFGLYWFVVQRNLKAQNMLLVIASYVFYGWWDWRFLGLIAFSTLVDYLVGLQIESAPEKRTKKAWLNCAPFATSNSCSSTRPNSAKNHSICLLVSMASRTSTATGGPEPKRHRTSMTTTTMLKLAL